MPTFVRTLVAAHVLAALSLAAAACGSGDENAGTDTHGASTGSASDTSGGESSETGGAEGGGGCTDECATAAPEGPATRDLVIEWVDIAGNRMGVRNLSAEAVDFTGWQLCANNLRYAAVNVSEVAAGAIAELDTSGLTGGLDSDADSLGLYDSMAFETPESLFAYVQWGEGGQIREPVAVSAGLWTADDFITICDGHAGFVAIGDTTKSTGYRSQPASCLGS